MKKKGASAPLFGFASGESSKIKTLVGKGGRGVEKSILIVNFSVLLWQN